MSNDLSELKDQHAILLQDVSQLRDQNALLLQSAQQTEALLQTLISSMTPEVSPAHSLIQGEQGVSKKLQFFPSNIPQLDSHTTGKRAKLGGGAASD